MEYVTKNLKQQVFSYNNNEQISNITGIPNLLKKKLEDRTGMNFDDVQIHYNSPRPAQLQALAYTQGNNVYIAPGQEKYLNHELGHVVQQKQGKVRPTGIINGFQINDEPYFETNADQILHETQVDNEIHPVTSNVIQRKIPVVGATFYRCSSRLIEF